jgi:predicted ATP-grasp superfamily ATP-dependent carboligase
MKVLIYEEITAAHEPHMASAGLLAEGSAMLQWLVTSATKNHINARVLLHPQLHHLAHPLPWLPSGEPGWREALSWADAVLAVAPETDQRLLNLSRKVMSTGKHWLGCSPQAIALASSKTQTCKRLSAQGIASVPGYSLGETPAPHQGLWITKPDDGCGCEGQQRHDSWQKALARLQQNPTQLAQPWLEGTPKSLCLWVHGPSHVDVLAVNHQGVEISASGVPTLASLTTDAEPVAACHQQLAKNVTQALEGLWGMVGIDFVEQPDGSLVVLEVNPRMTTSFSNLEPFFWLK